MEPSRATSLCAKLAWRQNTRRLSLLLRLHVGNAHQGTRQEKAASGSAKRRLRLCERTHGGQAARVNGVHDPANSRFCSNAYSL